MPRRTYGPPSARRGWWDQHEPVEVPPARWERLEMDRWPAIDIETGPISGRQASAIIFDEAAEMEHRRHAQAMFEQMQEARWAAHDDYVDTMLTAASGIVYPPYESFTERTTRNRRELGARRELCTSFDETNMSWHYTDDPVSAKNTNGSLLFGWDQLGVTRRRITNDDRVAYRTLPQGQSIVDAARILTRYYATEDKLEKLLVRNSSSSSIDQLVTLHPVFEKSTFHEQGWGGSCTCSRDTWNDGTSGTGDEGRFGHTLLFMNGAWHAKGGTSWGKHIWHKLDPEAFR